MGLLTVLLRCTNSQWTDEWPRRKHNHQNQYLEVLIQYHSTNRIRHQHIGKRCHLVAQPPVVNSNASVPLPCVRFFDMLLIVVLRVQDPQNGEEEVDDVKVQRDGGSDLLLDMVVAHDQLRVDQNVAREDKRCDHSIAELNSAAVREEHGHEAKQDQDPERAKQVRHPACEVVLALASKQGKRNKDAEREDGCFYYDLGVCERNDDRDGVRFHGSESTKEQQVCRVRLALPESETQECEGAEHRHPHHPRICLYPVLVRGRDHRDVAYGGGGEDLDSAGKSQ